MRFVTGVQRLASRYGYLKAINNVEEDFATKILVTMMVMMMVVM